MEGNDNNEESLTSWDWQSKDNRIKKRVLEKGWWNGSRPTEGSPCIIRIDTHGYEDFTIPLGCRMPSTDQYKLFVGEGDTEFERILDRLLPTMDAFEECLVEYLIDERLYNVKIKLIQHGPGLPSYQLDPDKKYEKAIKFKQRGVELFKEGRTLDAFYRFKRAAQLLIFLGRNHEQYLPTFITVCNNLAQCYLNMGNFENVLGLCEKVLEKDPTNVKCLLRYAAALETLKNFEKALIVYKKVIEIESNNCRAIERLPVVKKAVDDMNEKYNQVVKKMFNFS